MATRKYPDEWNPPTIIIAGGQIEPGDTIIFGEGIDRAAQDNREATNFEAEARLEWNELYGRAVGNSQAMSVADGKAFEREFVRFAARILRCEAALREIAALNSTIYSHDATEHSARWVMMNQIARKALEGTP